MSQENPRELVFPRQFIPHPSPPPFFQRASHRLRLPPRGGKLRHPVGKYVASERSAQQRSNGARIFAETSSLHACYFSTESPRRLSSPPTARRNFGCHFMDLFSFSLPFFSSSSSSKVFQRRPTPSGTVPSAYLLRRREEGGKREGKERERGGEDKFKGESRVLG